MPSDNLVKFERKYAGAQAKKLAGGDLVSDDETRQFKDKAQGIAEQGLAAQQKALTRSQAAMAQGSPVAAGAMTAGGQALGTAAAGAAVQASGQAQDLSSALREQRKGQALTQISGQADLQRQKRARAVKVAMAGAEAAAQIIGTIAGGPAGGAAAGEGVGSFGDAATEGT